MPARPGLINEVFARLSGDAAGVALEWVGLGPHLCTSVADEQIDLAFLGADMEAYGLVGRRPPDDLPDITFRFFWSARLAADPGNRWLRRIVIGAYGALWAEAMVKQAAFHGGLLPANGVIAIAFGPEMRVRSGPEPVSLFALAAFLKLASTRSS